MQAWYNKVSGAVEDTRDVIYNMQTQIDKTEILSLENSINSEYTLMMLEEDML